MAGVSFLHANMVQCRCCHTRRRLVNGHLPKEWLRLPKSDTCLCDNCFIKIMNGFLNRLDNRLAALN